MNIIAGWIVPEMNCARKLAAYSASLCSVEDRHRLAAAGRTPSPARARCTSPRCAPFSLPVVDHCLTNCGCARLPILRHHEHRDRHGDQRDQRQQRGDPEHHASTPTMVSSEVTTWLSVCCSDWARLSMSLVTRLSISPRGCAVEVAQRQPGQLGLHLLAQPEHRALHDRGGDPALEQREHRRGDVERQHDEQQPARLRRSRCPARGAACSELIRSARVPLPSCRSPATTSALVVPAGICWPITPAKIRSVALPRILGPSTDSVDADHAPAAARRRSSGRCGAQHAQQPLARPAEVQRLLGRPAAHEGGRAAPMPGAGPGRARGSPAARRRAAPPLAAPRRSCRRRCRALAAGRLLAGHAASCSVSWESTISR